MGRRPLPTAVKKLRGNPGKRPLDDREPRPAKAERTPGAPRWLTEEARQTWRQLTPGLHRTGLLSEVDTMSLGMLCEAYALFIKARQVVADEGILAISINGSVYQHPAIGLMNRARADVYQWGREFGMMPAARSGIVLNPAGEPDDELAEWFFGG